MDRKLMFEFDDLKNKIKDNRRQDIEDEFINYFETIEEELNLSEAQMVVLRNITNYGLKSCVHSIIDNYDKFL